jgi:dolichol-phosphate mannosyltransferase
MRTVGIDLSIVVPCLNEEKLVPKFFSRAKAAADKVTYRWEIVMVDDGSTDSTWDAIREHHLQNSKFEEAVLFLADLSS